MQDKRAEIKLMRQELEELYWEDRPPQVNSRKKQIQLLQPILSTDTLILDAGCGPGNYGILLGKHNHVIGVDISSEATAFAIQRARKADAQFLPLAADLEKLPFNNNCFDTCLCAYTLHHFPSIHNVVGELVRVTKPGGKVIILDANGSNPGLQLSIVMERLMSRWLVAKGLDTPNETHHTHKDLSIALQEQGVGDIWIHSHFFGGLPPMRPNPDFVLSVIHFMIRVRRIMYSIMSKALPQPIKGVDLLVVGTKQ
ncbi:MAG: class I SAM-dependent methyltransferase [Chloroflexota bacterium]|nr:class I SAM-dependent methyltransferase [Chloroflexota bacterium]